MPVTITKKWLRDNATSAMGWTYAQLDVLGVPVPPTTGWQDDLVGRVISDETAAQFALAVNIRATASRRRARQSQKSPSPSLLETAKPPIGLKAFTDELRQWWSFDDHQQHTHSWHTREDFISKKLPELLTALYHEHGAEFERQMKEADDSM
jgi:hypothetical protein